MTMCQSKRTGAPSGAPILLRRVPGANRVRRESGGRPRSIDRNMAPVRPPAPRRKAALAKFVPALIPALAMLLFASGAAAQEVPPPAMPLAVASFAPVPVNLGFVSVRATPPSELVQVRNLGSADLVVTSITPTDPTLTVDLTSLPAIPEGGTASFRVFFDPETAGSLPATAGIDIVSNDAFNPDYRLPVRGAGVDVAVSVSPAERVMVPGQHLTFTPTVTGAAANPGVTWSVEGTGTINGGGTFLAPATPGTTIIRATSVLDPETSGTASVQVLDPDVAVDAEPDLGAGHYGARVTTGDLDGDGFPEVMVAAPDADADTPGGTVAGAGAVWIRSFGTTGFTGSVTRLTSPVPVAGGGFGAALLVADLNDDGRPDLVVGEPGGEGATAAAGAVHFYAGDGAGGFDPPVTTAPAGLLPGARFGAALASGYFGGDGPLLLAVGAPGEDVGGDPQAGAVHVVDPVAGASLVTVPPPMPEAAAEFGAALASACLDDCTGYVPISGTDPIFRTQLLQHNDLVVGAPGATVDAESGSLPGAGRVWAFAWSGDPGDPFPEPWEVVDPVPTAGARFGAALAAGDLTGDVIQDVAVGAPGQPAVTEGADPGAGMVFTFASDGFGAFAPLEDLYERVPTAGAGFGSVVDMHDLDADGRADLTVAAPMPGGDGRVIAYYGTGVGDFGRMRVFPAPASASGASFGAALAWRDLNLDGKPDLLAGAPETAGGTAGSGALHVHLDLPPAPITVVPARVTLARRTTNSQKVVFVGSLAPESDAWQVLAGPGRVNDSGTYTASITPGTRLSDDVIVGLRRAGNANEWGLAHVRLVGAVNGLYLPAMKIADDGTLLMSDQPEDGAQFAAALQVVNIGRASTDPYPGLPSVLASFTSGSGTDLPRVARFPFDADPTAPFTSIQLYFGQPTAARTNWGAQIAAGDFDGDGNEDFAVSAPYAPSEDSSEVQVGYVDIYRLSATGQLAGGVIRLIPTPSMLAPDGTTLWKGTDARSNIRYGFRLIADDLNGDGRSDLVVGMPHADLCAGATASECEGTAGVTNKIRDAGVVEVLLAPSPSLYTTTDWTQGVARATILDTAPHQGAYFGSALGVGDVTGDGIPELYVGAPGRDPQGREPDLIYNPAGQVQVVAPSDWNHTTSEGLRATLAGAGRLAITDPSPAPAGLFNGFGTSVEVADFVPEAAGNPAADELAVGVPHQVLIDPARRDLGLVPLKEETGAVELYDGDGGLTVRSLGPVLPPVRQAGMGFGEVMTTAHLHGPAAHPDLVVGAPFFDTSAGANAGAVFVFEATDTLPRYRMTITAPLEAALDQFGNTLEAGDLDLDGTDELLVSAPNADISQVIGYQIFPDRHRGPEPIISTAEHTGRVYVIFPELP
jgi:hypothetical protein